MGKERGITLIETVIVLIMLSTLTIISAGYNTSTFGISKAAGDKHKEQMEVFSFIEKVSSEDWTKVDEWENVSELEDESEPNPIYIYKGEDVDIVIKHFPDNSEYGTDKLMIVIDADGTKRTLTLEKRKQL